MLNQSQSLQCDTMKNRCTATVQIPSKVFMSSLLCQVQRETEVNRKNSLLQRHPQGEGNSPSLSLYRLRVTFRSKYPGRMPECCSIQQPEQKLVSSSSSLLAFHNVKSEGKHSTLKFSVTFICITNKTKHLPESKNNEVILCVVFQETGRHSTPTFFRKPSQHHISLKGRWNPAVGQSGKPTRARG